MFSKCTSCHAIVEINLLRQGVCRGCSGGTTFVKKILYTCDRCHVDVPEEFVAYIYNKKICVKCLKEELEEQRLTCKKCKVACDITSDGLCVECANYARQKSRIISETIEINKNKNKKQRRIILD